jgi:hypothetical protein
MALSVEPNRIIWTGIETDLASTLNTPPMFCRRFRDLTGRQRLNASCSSSTPLFSTVTMAGMVGGSMA